MIIKLVGGDGHRIFKVIDPYMAKCFHAVGLFINQGGITINNGLLLGDLYISCKFFEINPVFLSALQNFRLIPQLIRTLCKRNEIGLAEKIV